MSAGRKRKADDEPQDSDRMSTSPTPANRQLPHALTPRRIKRTRTNTSGGRPLALPRLLETLNADDMRQLLHDICDEHPDISHAVVTKAPRPNIDTTLAVLAKYETTFREAFPIGNRPSSDYAYNRVRQAMLELIDAMKDFTPHFLPPHETQPTLSMTYLNAVTDMIHRLPDWDSYQHNRHKHEAYDEISRAWALVVREAAKRAGGFHLQFGGWDQKLLKHNELSGGRMEEAVQELRAGTGLAGTAASGAMDERASIRQQLFSGTYGQDLSVGTAGW